MISTRVQESGGGRGCGTERPRSTVTESTGLGPGRPGFKSHSASYQLRDFGQPLFASASESEATVRKMKLVSGRKVPGAWAPQ